MAGITAAGAGGVDEVMMARDALHGPVFLVWKKRVQDGRSGCRLHEDAHAADGCG